jgi:ribosomal protein S18 acetylase RimI-like enzyme
MLTDAPLSAATDAELAIAVQENLFAFFRALRVAPGYEAVESDRLCFHHASPANPMFKSVWRARLKPDEAEAAIVEVLAWFKARHSPYVFWWAGLGDQPADLRDRLKAHGFAVRVPNDPGMALDLRSLDELVPLPAGLTVELATDQKSLEDWRDAFVSSYQNPRATGQAWVDATLAAGPRSAPWRLYIGYLDGQPVATSVIFLGAGVAGLYGVGTVPAARRQGLGAAVTRHSLLDARAQGYRYAVGFATETGHSMYRRLGCYDVPCSIARFPLWFV